MQQQSFNAGLAYSDFKQRQFFYILAAFVAFTMSSYFVIGYLAGNLHPWTWDSGQWMNAFVAMGITGVMTGYQFVLYSQGNVEGGKKATIIAVCVAVGFSLLSEIGQGMERDNIRMETKSQESPTYKAAVAALGRLSGSSSIGASPYAADIASAQMKYNQCMERLAKGKEPHCEGSKGRLESYQQQEAAWAERASATSTNTASALLSQAKGLEKDETNYHPLVNLIRETFGASGTVGSFLLSLVLISFFEYAFHYLGGQYARAREYLMQNGYDVTRRLRQPPRKHDGSISTYSDNAPAPSASPVTPFQAMKQEFSNMVESAPEVIANEYARAQQSRQQVYSKAADKLDAVQDDLNKHAAFLKLLVMEAQASVNHGMEPTQENIRNVIAHVLRRHQQTTGQNTQHVDLDKLTGLVIGKIKPAANSQSGDVKTYRAELREGEKVYSDSPLDKPRPADWKPTFERTTIREVLERDNNSPALADNTLAMPEKPQRLSVEATVKQIQQTVKASGETAPDAIREAVFNAFAAMPNPAPLDDAILQRIADKLVINAAHVRTTSGATPDYQKGSDAAKQSATSGATPDYQKGSDAAKQSATSGATPDYQKGSDAAKQSATSGTTPDYQKGSDAAPTQASIDRLYIVWRDAVKGGAISPAERPFTLLVREHADFDGVQNRQLKALWDQFCLRAESESVLMQNPDFVEGNRKAKYLLAA
ncbi:hypothetical protein [Thiothrix nivea]|uniref:Uncharacterized protein n=1 Tax=Thiothrix nivea (strain ATCC 35100 / DSM 5205 / JP2) TaxID=870187 RepID=A0A656H980_THINJ|nr:hypothetical protein [Thiothrix nivea]EIJ33361.1 hypothetical protein Thini_0724 [Thiothrix nivea DSM 5205]